MLFLCSHHYFDHLSILPRRYTTIVAGDPVLESTLRIVKDTLAVVGQLIPIRLGFVFTSPQLAEWANAQIGAADDAASFFAALDAGGLTAPAALVAASAVARGQTGGGDAARPATTLEFLSLMHALKQNGTRSQVNSFLQRLAADAGNAASRDFVGDAHGDERRLTVGALRGAFVRVTRGRDWKGAAPATLLAGPFFISFVCSFSFLLFAHLFFCFLYSFVYSSQRRSRRATSHRSRRLRCAPPRGPALRICRCRRS